MICIQILLLIIPTLLSGLLFIFVLKTHIFDLLKIPIDCGLTINKKRLFGKNKTLLGFILFPLITCIWGLFSYDVYNQFFSLNMNVTDTTFNFFLLGLSYPLFELPNSFMKRQLEIPPGETYSGNTLFRLILNTIDQVDGFIGNAIVYIFVFHIEPTPNIVLATVVIGISLHLLTDTLMRRLRLKK